MVEATACCLATLSQTDNNHPLQEGLRLLHTLALVPANVQHLREVGAAKVVRAAMAALQEKTWVEHETKQWGTRALAVLPGA